MKEIKFTLPDISDLEIQNVVEVLRSGWITTGPKTKELEKKLASFIYGYDDHATCCMTQPRCVCLGSATAAMEMALRLLGIGAQAGGSADDEVITCAYTYTASASVINHVGAKIVLVDCSEEDGSIEMDYDKLEAAITPNTKAIIPVDIAGVPCDYDRIFEIVERKRGIFRPDGKTIGNGGSLQKAIGRITVLADGAHALGASYKGKMVGNVADFTAFSFHATKNFTTAEGGALLWRHIDGTDDSEIYRQIQLFSLHGQSKDAFAKTSPLLTGGLGGLAWEYDIIGTWYKCNMTDLAAAVGLGQLARYQGMLARRREIIERYDAAFRPLGIKTLDHFPSLLALSRCSGEQSSERQAQDKRKLRINSEHTSSGHVYITRIPGLNREQTNEIMAQMAEAGICTNVHFKPLPMHTAYKNLGFDIKDYPVAYAKFENEITLPLHTKLTDEEVEYVINTYKRIVERSSLSGFALNAKKYIK